MTQPTYIGIDPGVRGAIAVLQGTAAFVYDMPIIDVGKGGKERNVVDAPALTMLLHKIIAEHRACDMRGWIEEVGSRSTDSGMRAFRFGMGYGVILGVLGALGVPYRQVRPQVWKARWQLIGKDKSYSLLAARHTYPALVDQLRRAKDDGRAEALLIAEYGRQLDGYRASDVLKGTK